MGWEARHLGLPQTLGQTRDTSLCLRFFIRRARTRAPDFGMGVNVTEVALVIGEAQGHSAESSSHRNVLMLNRGGRIKM